MSMLGRALKGVNTLWKGALKGVNHLSSWVNKKLPTGLKYLGIARGMLGGAKDVPWLRDLRPYLERAEQGASALERAGERVGDISKRLEQGSREAQMGLGSGYNRLLSGGMDIGRGIMDLRRMMTRG